MIIPQTTKEQPYIEFIINKKGDVTISPNPTSSWWGGIKQRFVASDGTGGNTCFPKDLERYIKAYKKTKIKKLKDNIKNLRLELKILTEQP